MDFALSADTPAMFEMTEMQIGLQAAPVVLRQAAWKLDQCPQLHGHHGYRADYGIEKLVRGLRVHQILEGRNEIMRLIVARPMLAGR